MTPEMLLVLAVIALGWPVGLALALYSTRTKPFKVPPLKPVGARKYYFDDGKQFYDTATSERIHGPATWTYRGALERYPVSFETFYRSKQGDYYKVTDVVNKAGEIERTYWRHLKGLRGSGEISGLCLAISIQDNPDLSRKLERHASECARPELDAMFGKDERVES